jgi:hypothetical protein
LKHKNARKVSRAAKDDNVPKSPKASPINKPQGRMHPPSIKTGVEHLPTKPQVPCSLHKDGEQHPKSKSAMPCRLPKMSVHQNPPAKFNIRVHHNSPAKSNIGVHKNSLSKSNTDVHHNPLAKSDMGVHQHPLTKSKKNVHHNPPLKSNIGVHQSPPAKPDMGFHHNPPSNVPTQPPQPSVKPALVRSNVPDHPLRLPVPHVRQPHPPSTPKPAAVELRKRKVFFKEEKRNGHDSGSGKSTVHGMTHSIRKSTYLSKVHLLNPA